jgi:NIPSNAP
MAAPPDSQSPPLIELRQYTLHPGQRDILIALFEREFIESQESLGMTVVGTFRDLDRSDRFVWIRGFRDMPSRAQGLEAFYSGPVWKAHSNAANATMLESDDVLLLRVVRADSGLDLGNRTRPPKGATAIPRGLVVVNVDSFAAPVGAEFIDFFDRRVEPELRAAGVTVQGAYVTERRPNNFPRLPVRENENVFVWFSSFEDPSDHERRLARLAGSAVWRAIAGELQARLKGPTEVLRLEPTPRSLLPGRAGAGLPGGR